MFLVLRSSLIANETKEFKKTLKRFLLNSSFYSVDEFFNYEE